jgi:carbonic anhydrase
MTKQSCTCSETASLSRRGLLGAAVGVGGLAAAGSAAAQGTRRGATSNPYRLAPTVNGKSALTPDQALDLLKQGNRDFLADRPFEAPVGNRRRLELASGQAPFAAYVSCSDSRVPPELLFGRGLGELFIVRNAGNTVDTTALGSIEFAVGVLGVPLVVVMGHEACGAVKAAMDVVEKNATFPGSIGAMIEPIVPAVLASRGRPGDKTEQAVRANVSRQVQRLRTAAEPILLDPQRAGRVKVVGAYYDLDTGRVDFFDEPRAARA